MNEGDGELPIVPLFSLELVLEMCGCGEIGTHKRHTSTQMSRKINQKHIYRKMMLHLRLFPGE